MTSAGHGAPGDPVTASSADLGAGSGATKVPETPSRSAAYTLEMDEYEVANLREGLLFLRAVGGDTGDWMGQLLMKLPEVERKPNATCQEQRRSLAHRVGWKALWPS